MSTACSKLSFPSKTLSRTFSHAYRIVRDETERFSKTVPCAPRYTAFSTISVPLRAIRSYGPCERIQNDIVDMTPGKKR